jgi:uncharacterized protein (TIGR03083 family)
MSENTGRPDGIAKQTVVGTLVKEWQDLDHLLTGLSADQWTVPTVLPGWRVTDVVAHLIGTEATLAGDDVPVTEVDVTTLPHVHNDIARANEQWVQALRGEPPPAMLARFREVTARRRAMLEKMPQSEFDAPSWTPAGPGTYGRFMQIRIFDCWLHEQDIRDAVGLPGNASGPAAEAALDEAARALGYVVGKRAAAPDGSTVLFELTGPVPRRLTVAVSGRARLVAEPAGPPTATLRLPSSAFLRLCGGRTRHSERPDVEMDVEMDVALDGDLALARRILDNLAFTI